MFWVGINYFRFTLFLASATAFHITKSFTTNYRNCFTICHAHCESTAIGGQYRTVIEKRTPMKYPFGLEYVFSCSGLLLLTSDLCLNIFIHKGKHFIWNSPSHNVALCSGIASNIGLYNPYRMMFCKKNKGKGRLVTWKTGTQGR
jgi:hypothetical protein